MEIRQIRAGDGLRNRDVRIRMLTDAPEAFGATLVVALARPKESWHEQASELASAAQRTLFVADDGERWQAVAGGILAEDNASVEIIAVWVDPAYRGQGLARALIGRVLDWGQAHGADRALLWVHDRNAAAIGLYQHLGFTTTTERKALGTDGDRMQVLMTRTLP